jgi:hypothetical protein
MKNAYLNGVLNFRVYLLVIKNKKQKKQKYIDNKVKKRRKIRRK